MSNGRFDDIFRAAAGEPKSSNEQSSQPESETIKPTETTKKVTGKAATKTTTPQARAKEFWADLEVPEREATIRLNVDIPISLNDKLAQKARQFRQPKTELVRKLIEWALDESNE